MPLEQSIGTLQGSPILLAVQIVLSGEGKNASRHTHCPKVHLEFPTANEQSVLEVHAEPILRLVHCVLVLVS